MSAPDQVPILVVEDSEDDLFFFRRLISKAGVSAPTVATDGQKAIDHIATALDQKAAKKPALPRIVFLDLKLPLRGGFEVLQWIRAQPALAQMVVVVLSSSAETRDVKQAFEMGAQGYLVKYPAASVFTEILRLVAENQSAGAAQKLVLPGLARP